MFGETIEFKVIGGGIGPGAGAPKDGCGVWQGLGNGEPKIGSLGVLGVECVKSRPIRKICCFRHALSLKNESS